MLALLSLPSLILLLTNLSVSVNHPIRLSITLRDGISRWWVTASVFVYVLFTSSCRQYHYVSYHSVTSSDACLSCTFPFCCSNDSFDPTPCPCLSAVPLGRRHWTCSFVLLADTFPPYLRHFPLGMSVSSPSAISKPFRIGHIFL